MLTTLVFWRAACERAIKTFAQTLVVLLGAGATGITSVPWADNLGIAATTAVLSLLTSVASSTVGLPGPSLATESVPVPVPVTPVVGPAALVLPPTV